MYPYIYIYASIYIYIYTPRVKQEAGCVLPSGCETLWRVGKGCLKFEVKQKLYLPFSFSAGSESALDSQALE